MVFYRNYYEEVIRVQTNLSGGYALGAFDNINIPIMSGGSYWVAVERGSDSYGADPVPVTITGTGYETVNLTLAPNAGPIPLAMQEGPVMLDIKRLSDSENGDIKVSWSINTIRYPTLSPTAPIDVYMLQGDGTGRFDPTTGWIKIVANNVLEPSATGFTINVPERSFTHSRQVKVDPKEVYFKALLTGRAPLTPGEYGLEGAIAAGKFNLILDRGFNLIAPPFFNISNEVGAVIGDQLASATVTESSNDIYNFDDETKVPAKASYVNSRWNLTSDFAIVYGKGYWLNLNKPDGTGTTATLTLVGKALPENTKTIYRGFNLIGNPSVFNRALGSVGFVYTTTPGSYSGTPSDPGDDIYNFSPAAKATLNSGTWATTSAFGFKVGTGYWYEAKKGAPYTPFNWIFR